MLTVTNLLSCTIFFTYAATASAKRPCSTEGLERKRGEFIGIDLNDKHVVHGSKARLICSDSKPGRIATARLVSDPVIECRDGQWHPPDAFHCFIGCTTEGLHRATGSWEFSRDPVEGRVDFGTKAHLICPEDHFIALGDRGVLKHKKLTKSYCVKGQWFPQLYCWSNRLEPAYELKVPIQKRKVLETIRENRRKEDKIFAERAKLESKTGKGCFDVNLRQCPHWKIWCLKNSKYMQRNCRKSCGLCRE